MEGSFTFPNVADRYLLIITGCSVILETESRYQQLNGNYAFRR
jgi:hypothetical protein